MKIKNYINSLSLIKSYFYLLEKFNLELHLINKNYSMFENYQFCDQSLEIVHKMINFIFKKIKQLIV